MAVTMEAPLKIGILAAGRNQFENWHLMVFDRIAADPRFSLATIIIHQAPSKTRRTSRLFEFQSQLERRFFLTKQRPYRPERFCFKQQRFDDLGTRDLSEGEGHAALQKLVDDLGLYLIIRMTPETLPQDIVRTLPFGEWALSCSDQRSRAADWFAYGDAISKAASTELTLYVSRGTTDHVEVIASSSFNTKISAAHGAASIKE